MTNYWLGHLLEGVLEGMEFDQEAIVGVYGSLKMVLVLL